MNYKLGLGWAAVLVIAAFFLGRMSGASAQARTQVTG